MRLNKDELKKAIEALLFVSFNHVTADMLALVLEENKQLIEEVLEELKQEYSTKGIRIARVAQGYRMISAPEEASFIEKIYKKTSKQFLSRASLETLAIIAFKQPITRSQIENLRGVNVDKIINNLLEKRLIKEAGKAPVLGKPILYGTDAEFLRYFNLNSLEDMPEFKQYLEFFQTQQNTEQEMTHQNNDEPDTKSNEPAGNDIIENESGEVYAEENFH